MKCPYLSDVHIEREASLVLSGYEKKYGEISGFATPIEEIIENYLRYTLEMRPLQDADILGFINLGKKLIVVNSILDPQENSAVSNNGRARYTMGHECGHEILHGYMYHERISSPLLWEENNSEQILCRSSNKKPRVEWQADYFSAAVLMPKRKMIACWKIITGADAPLYVKKIDASMRIGHIVLPDSYDVVVVDNVNVPLYDFVTSFAENFEVSRQAVSIRLKQLNLLREDATLELLPA